MAQRKRKINPQLEALRKDVQRKQRNAAAKMRRIEKTTGAVLNNSQADPRVNFAKLARYTTKQLLAQSRKLDEFNHRNNQYVAGVGGVPLPRAKWNQYLNEQAKNNRIVAERMAEFGNVKIPGAGVTIQQRNEEILGDSLRSHGAAVNKPYVKLTREAHNIPSVEALDKLLVDMRKKNNRSYIQEKVDRGRRELREMLDDLGMPDLIDLADSLTDNQFDIFWHETAGAFDASHIYEIMKRRAAGQRERSDLSQLEDNANDLRELFEWARDELPKDVKPRR